MLQHPIESYCPKIIFSSRKYYNKYPMRRSFTSLHNKPQLSRSILPAVPGKEASTVKSDMNGVIDKNSRKWIVVVRRNKQSFEFRNGSPLVFGGSLSYTGEITDEEKNEVSCIPMGAVVAVAVDKNACTKVNKKITHFDLNSNNEKEYEIIGYGVYNPESMYRVRILCHKTLDYSCFKYLDENIKEESMMKAILQHKFQNAIQGRIALDLPNSKTDTFRLLNSEGDGLSGLSIDILGGKVVVVMSSASWCEHYKSIIIKELKDCLQAYLPDNEIIWRLTPSRLEQDGYKLSPQISQENKNYILAKENIILYKVYPWWSVQKTGFYCDQRENRDYLASFCKDKTVLDLCCYFGGFSLNAANRGAKHCIGVDSSQHAIDCASETAKLNNLDNKCTFIKQDISKYLKNLPSTKEFDVIVLDPPKLCPNWKTLHKGSRKYLQLNRDALKKINVQKGGLFFTCTCSGAMTQKDNGKFFINVIKEAATAAKREIRLIQMNGAAGCHVQSAYHYPLGSYLTTLLFYVSPSK